MRVDEHLSGRERVSEFPLVTASGTVTAVEAMDRSRNDEVLRAIRRTLDGRGGAAWRHERPTDEVSRRRLIREKLDRIDRGTPLNEYLPPAARRGRVGGRLRSLQERYLRPYPSLIRILVEADEPVEFLPGQYLSVRYGGTTRAYSIASSPDGDGIEFCIRRVPGGRLTPTLSVDLEAGDGITLRGPYGDFVMGSPSARDPVFLATGTGVAPFRSMIERVFEAGLDRYRGAERDVWLFLGAAWEDDLPYRETFRAFEREHPNFHFVPTLSREAVLSEWDGETAYVQYALVKYLADDALASADLPGEFDPYLGEAPAVATDARLRPGSMEVYACGINAMVHGLVRTVERIGVPERHTSFEGFG